MGEITIKPLTLDLLPDLDALFKTSAETKRCWCMWFITSVKQYQADGSAGNRQSFLDLMESEGEPMGLLAYLDERPVGWCAIGPRSRYARAIKTPTYKGRDKDLDDKIWLAPCFYVDKDARGLGIADKLLEKAVELAQDRGATAVDGFPFAGSKRQSKGDVQVGFEPLFAGRDFETIRTPSAKRIVVRRTLRE